MELEIMYRKEYSLIPKLQASTSVQYILTRGTEEGRPVYGVRITEIGRDWMEHEDYFPLSTCRAEAEQVLTYLFENAVPASQCQAVASDLAVILNGSERNGERAYQALDCG